MIKRSHSILAALLVCVAAIAGPVTPQQARQKALQFMNKDGKRTVRAVKMAGNMSKGAANNAAALQDYYIFNAEESNSFVIISGEDRLPDVFGYGENGCLDTESMPENMKTVLGMYARLVKHVASMPEDCTPRNIPLAARQAKGEITKLLKSQWSQEYPYNSLCPYDGYKRSATGCAATSMAQVMYYHKWPEAECEPIPGYYSRALEKNLDGLDGTTFKWNKMKDTYGWYDTDTEKSVATLMQYCGYSIEMSYSSQGSGAFSFMQPYALKKYFGYDKRTRTLYRDNFPLDVWNNIIYNELAEGRPVVYSGLTPKQEGHSFVIDGYRSIDGFYHVNWGWNGTSDGYFDITILNPENTTSTGSASTDDGFSIGQDAIIGMQKPTGEQGMLEAYLNADILSLRNNILECTFGNYSPESNTFDFGIGCYGNDGNIVALQTESNNDFKRLTYVKSVKFNLASIISTPGKYKVFPISKLSSEQEWQPGDAADYIYAEATLDANGNLTSVMYPLAEMHAEKMSLSDTTLVNKEMTATYSIVNEKNEPRECKLYFMAKSEDNNDVIRKDADLKIDANGKKEVTFKFTPKRSQNYRFMLAYDNQFNSCISDETHRLGGEAPKLEAEFNVNGSENKNKGNVVYSKVAEGTLNIKNIDERPYAGNVRIQLAHKNSSGSNIVEKTRNTAVSIGTNETEEVAFRFTGLKKGKKYALIFSYEFNDFIKAGEYVFTVKDPETNAINVTETDVQENGNAPAYDITGRKVSANEGSLQRGIYIRNGKKYVRK